MYVTYTDGVDEEIPVTEARAQFSELVNRVGYGKERIVLTRHGKPLVALVPAEDLAADEENDAPATVLDLSARTSREASSPMTIAAQDPSRPRA
jgi:prevent-host-death family protein